MTSLEAFLQCADAYASAKGLKESSLSTYMLNHSRKLGALRNGTSDIGIKQLEKAMRWLSKHWPEGTAWPEGIARPAPLMEVSDA